MLQIDIGEMAAVPTVRSAHHHPPSREMVIHDKRACARTIPAACYGRCSPDLMTAPFGQTQAVQLIAVGAGGEYGQPERDVGLHSPFARATVERRCMHPHSSAHDRSNSLSCDAHAVEQKVE